MGRSYKNFWSLNVDEAVVTGILRESIPKNFEVLMPLNAQMKDIDLVLMNMVTQKTLKIQIKGSRAYEGSDREQKEYGNGSATWVTLQKAKVMESSADYFIFLLYVLSSNSKLGRGTIRPHTLAIATADLQQKIRNYKGSTSGEKYNIFFWVNPDNKKATWYRGLNMDMSEYLDNKGLQKMNSVLR